MRVNTLKLAILFLGAMMLPMPTAFMGVDLLSTAHADTTTKDIAVNASVPNNCNFTGGAITLAFGSYDPVGANASADKDGSTSFTFRCTKGGSAALGLDLGDNANASQRRMIFGSEYLNYELYSDAGRTSVWGASGAADVEYTAESATPVTFDVYGRIPSAQDVSIGNYADTVTITATFTP